LRWLSLFKSYRNKLKNTYQDDSQSSFQHTKIFSESEQ
jgi:hypothetical protein